MLDKIFFAKKAKGRRGAQAPACEDEKRFESLYVQSFQDMRARSLRR